MRGRAPLRGTCGCDSGLMGAGSEHTGEPLAACYFATGVLTCHLPTVVLAPHLLPAARVRAVAEPPFVLAWCPEGRATLLGLEALSRTGVESHTARRVLASGRGRGRSTGGSAAGGVGGTCLAGRGRLLPDTRMWAWVSVDTSCLLARAAHRGPQSSWPPSMRGPLAPSRRRGALRLRAGGTAVNLACSVGRL